MAQDQKLDDAKRTDLLCFLVLAQLIGHASTGGWLHTEQLVESARIWTASNSIECDWIERAKLARMSVDLALQFQTFPWFMDPGKMAELFVDGWRLNYGSAIVRGMLDVCAEHLARD